MSSYCFEVCGEKKQTKQKLLTTSFFYTVRRILSYGHNVPNN